MVAEEANNVFISWSEERSRLAAAALRKWLPVILQSAKPWMSDADIDKGSRGLEEVARALEGMKVGIICLTPENLTAAWILYEAGALSKTLDERTRVCTYLLGGLQHQDVKPPLGMFQATEATDKEETRKLVHSINRNLDAPVPEENLNMLFDRVWPDLEKELSAIPKTPGAAPPRRPTEEILAEILELNRTMTSEVGEIRREIRELETERRRKEFANQLAKMGIRLKPLDPVPTPAGLTPKRTPAEPVEPEK